MVPMCSNSNILLGLGWRELMALVLLAMAYLYMGTTILKLMCKGIFCEAQWMQYV